MSYMFATLRKLEDISGLKYMDVSLATNAYSMFSCNMNQPTLLKDISALSNWDTHNVTNMEAFFNRCIELESIEALRNWDAGNNTSLKYFLAVDSLITDLSPLENWDVSKVTSFFGAFYQLYKVREFSMNNWDFSSAIELRDIFFNCVSLTQVSGSCKNIKVSLSLAYSPLTADSAMVFINGLADITSHQTLTLKRTTYDSLTDEQKAVATAKGWSVVSA